MARTDETYSGAGRPHPGVAPELQRQVVEGNPRYQEQVAKEREARRRLGEVLAGEIQAFDIQQTPDQIINGHGPGYGPEMAMRDVYRSAGRFESKPGWSNPQEWATAGAKQAIEASESPPPGVSKEDWAADQYRRNLHLMTPEQFRYMQGPGRTLDLLASLRNPPSVAPSNSEIFGQSQSAPDFAMRLWDGIAGAPGGASVKSPLNSYRSMYWWDRSDATKNPDAIRTHDDFGSPVYQKFAGTGQNAARFVSDPTSPISRYLHQAQIPWNAIKFTLTDDDPNAVGDYSGLTGLLNGLSRAYTLYLQQGRQKLSPGGEVLDMPSLPADATPEQRRQHNQDYLKRRDELGRMVASMTPPSGQELVPGMPKALGDIVDIFGGAIDPSLVAGVTVGVSDKMARMAAKQAIKREALEQMAPEVAIGGGLNYALAGQPDSTWMDYATKPFTPAVDTEARSAAYRKAEVMAPQSLWQARQEAAKLLPKRPIEAHEAVFPVYP